MPPQGSESRRVAGVRRVLERERLEFEREPSIAGLRPDFLVYLPNGRRAVIEVKDWHSSAQNDRRAKSQSGFLREKTGIELSVVVSGHRPGTKLPAGVVSLQQLGPWLREHSRPLPPRKVLAKRVQKSRGVSVFRPDSVVFAAMPFDAKFDDVYFLAIAEAARRCSVSAYRVDTEEFSGDIVRQILKRIDGCAVLVADLSLLRPNVLFELGYARGKGKPCIQISRDSLTQLPFDVRNEKTIPYSSGQIHQLIGKLESALKAVLPRRAV